MDLLNNNQHSDSIINKDKSQTSSLKQKESSSRDKIKGATISLRSIVVIAKILKILPYYGIFKKRIKRSKVMHKLMFTQIVITVLLMLGIIQKIFINNINFTLTKSGKKTKRL